jgi:hypothetical protein
MKTWIMFDGTHINLATASTIEELGNQGLKGYKIYHGEAVLAIYAGTNKNDPKFHELQTILTTIRFYLYNNKIPAVAGGGREEGQ